MTSRSTRLLRWCLAWPLLAAPVLRAELSPRLRALVVADASPFVPPPPEPPRSDTPPPPLSDDPLVKLPEFRVNDSPLARVDPDRLLSSRGLQEKALSDYRKSMTAFEWALNRWHIPLITPSAKARALARYESLRLQRDLLHLASIAESVKAVDPAAAKKLKRAMDLSRHPEN